MLFWLFGIFTDCRNHKSLKRAESHLLTSLPNIFATPFPSPLPSTPTPQISHSRSESTRLADSTLLCSILESLPFTHAHMNSPRAMAARAARSRRRSNSSFQWSTLFYILLVLCAPMLLATAVRADDQVPLKDSAVSGPVIGIDLGTTYSCVGVSFHTSPQTNHDRG